MSFSERRRTGGSSVQLLFSPQTDPDRLTPATIPAPTHATGASHTTPTTPTAIDNVHGTNAAHRAPRSDRGACSVPAPEGRCRERRSGVSRSVWVTAGSTSGR